MIDPESIHWRYAAGNAFQALETQVRQFDFARFANGHTYSGLEPQKYIDIIDGFLAEAETVVPGGNRTALQKLREYLVHHILPAFSVGQQTAISMWNTSDPRTEPPTTDHARGQNDVISVPALHALARDRSPFSGVKSEWFIEGFCQAYARAELDSLR